MFGKKQIQKVPTFVVFIALTDSEGIAEHCPSHEEMMRKFFKYSKLLLTEEWLSLDDSTLRVDLIRYIRWIAQ